MFKLVSVDGEARVGFLKTKHGVIETPFFMPVATKGNIKFLSFTDLKKIGFQAFISNSFLLSRKPGLEVLKQAKGYHKFVNWSKGIFTDSGGFQLLDNSFLHKVTSKGVWLKDPYTMEKVFLTPKKSVEIQTIIGSDVAMVLDDVRHPYKPRKEHVEAVKNTINWAKEFKQNQENLKSFAIIQGGLNLDLRKKCSKKLVELDFDGYAIGGLSIGETEKEMNPIIKKTITNIPKTKPRYLMGVGNPKQILKAISTGIDCFDSTYPTRGARHGLIFTSKGTINLKKTKYAKDFTPLDENCKCKTCKTYSKAYLHHLLKVKEKTANQYLTHHNLYYVYNLVLEARKRIKEGTFKDFVKEFK